MKLLVRHIRLGVEEERDTLKANCLRSQTSIAELRTHEKNGVCVCVCVFVDQIQTLHFSFSKDLERKLSAIAKVEEISLSPTEPPSSKLQQQASIMLHAGPP